MPQHLKALALEAIRRTLEAVDADEDGILGVDDLADDILDALDRAGLTIAKKDA